MCALRRDLNPSLWMSQRRDMCLDTWLVPIDCRKDYRNNIFFLSMKPYWFFFDVLKRKASLQRWRWVVNDPSLPLSGYLHESVRTKKLNWPLPECSYGSKDSLSPLRIPLVHSGSATFKWELHGKPFPDTFSIYGPHHVWYRLLPTTWAFKHFF